MNKAESILEKNERLFQVHPLEEMYIEDKKAIIQCMKEYADEQNKELMEKLTKIESLVHQLQLDYEEHEELKPELDKLRGLSFLNQQDNE